MVIVILWLVFSFLVYVYASNKGLSGYPYLFASLILSPVIGFLCALVAKPDDPPDPDTKLCPFCAERIKRAAIVCKHCGRDLVDIPSCDPVTGIRPE